MIAEREVITTIICRLTEREAFDLLAILQLASINEDPLVRKIITELEALNLRYY